MVFRTELNLNKSPVSIKYANKIMLLGSCFSDNIGQKLYEFRFKPIANPCGTVYNAISIQHLLHRITHKILVSEFELDRHENVYSHADFHSRFNSNKINDSINSINEAIIAANSQMSNIDYTFITLGTSWVYKRKDKGNVVSNCHKRPQALYDKYLLSLEETITSLAEIIKVLKSVNPQNQVVFTISPVRHIKDGIVENQVSKAVLIQAVYSLCQKDLCHYFPSYELVVDDLRDYRFYKEDLIHPTDQAIHYVWEKFCQHYFDEKTLKVMAKVDRINTFLRHKPQVTDEKYISHYQKILEEAATLNRDHGLCIEIAPLPTIVS